MPNENNFDEYLKEVRVRLKQLEQVLIRDFEINKNEITQISELKTWLQYKNLLNSVRVCTAFKNGSVFYSCNSDTEAGVFLNEHFNSSDRVGLSTINSLQLVTYVRKDNGKPLSCANSYMIDDNSTSKPSQIIEEMLFARTSSECAGSIALTNYLTILDLLRLFYGKQEGGAVFDQLFSAKSDDDHTLNRLRVGTMGSLNQELYSQFSPLYFLTDNPEIIKLADLINKPEQYLGYQLGIRGVYGYHIWHPDGAEGGWNVCFAGLNKNQEPLFLAARGVGGNFIVTYNQLKKILIRGYNKLPEYNNRDVFNTKFSERITKHMGKYYENWTTEAALFDLNKIQLLVNNFPLFLKKLKLFCDKFYQEEILSEDLTAPKKVYSKTKYDNSLLWFKHVKENHLVKDDCFNNGRHSDEECIKDDLSLRRL